ncbi:hypothetical protein Q5P01_015394 [Channa striata]|uniref:Uncharacterized protein n=1 Tax=Channa striata TaxID=64152 RepID=A0AA88MLT6_CHASR|nr:hypothetical protein Q5P01_015394 [Channa striata]
MMSCFLPAKPGNPSAGPHTCVIQTESERNLVRLGKQRVDVGELNQGSCGSTEAPPPSIESPAAFCFLFQAEPGRMTTDDISILSRLPLHILLFS